MKRMKDRYYIKNLGISITNPKDAIQRIEACIEEKKSAQICVLNARATYHALKTEDYLKILNNSFLTIPDGKPLEIIGRLKGHKLMRRTSGPELFTEICKISVDKSYTHFFYGCTDEIINAMVENLKSKYKGITIVGAVAPPFGNPEKLANQGIIETIEAANPTFVWLGLGAPKQDYVSRILEQRLKNSIFIGIGLVFEYEAGTVKRPPEWISKMGFEWLFRIFVQFSRTKNFVLPFFYMVRLLITEYIKMIFRKTFYRNK